MLYAGFLQSADETRTPTSRCLPLSVLALCPFLHLVSDSLEGVLDNNSTSSLIVKR